MSTPSETTEERRRRQARERQARRRARLREERGELASRYCLCCLAEFQPRRIDSWFCSRRCVDQISYHRRQAQSALDASLWRHLGRVCMAEREGTTLEVVEQAHRTHPDPRRRAEMQMPDDIRSWWRSDTAEQRGADAAIHRLDALQAAIDRGEDPGALTRRSGVEAVARYRLWFPDLCGISPEQALVDREEFQRRCRQTVVS